MKRQTLHTGGNCTFFTRGEDDHRKVFVCNIYGDVKEVETHTMSRVFRIITAIIGWGLGLAIAIILLFLILSAVQSNADIHNTYFHTTASTDDIRSPVVLFKVDADGILDVEIHGYESMTEAAESFLDYLIKHGDLCERCLRMKNTSDARIELPRPYSSSGFFLLL